MWSRLLRFREFYQYCADSSGAGQCCENIQNYMDGTCCENGTPNFCNGVCCSGICTINGSCEVTATGCKAIDGSGKSCSDFQDCCASLTGIAVRVCVEYGTAYCLQVVVLRISVGGDWGINLDLWNWRISWMQVGGFFETDVSDCLWVQIYEPWIS